MLRKTGGRNGDLIRRGFRDTWNDLCRSQFQYPHPVLLISKWCHLGALLEHPFAYLASFQALLSPRTQCEVLRVSHSGLCRQAKPRWGPWLWGQVPSVCSWYPNGDWADQGSEWDGQQSVGKGFSPQRPKLCFSTQMQMKDQRALFLQVRFGRVINKSYRPERTLSVSK